MTFDYVLILVLYALACFGAVLVIVEAWVWTMQKRIVRRFEFLRPADGVMAHLVIRLLPPAVAFVLTCQAAVPSYLSGEPMRTRELPSAGLILLAAMGIYSIVDPLGRTISLFLRTRTRTRAWKRLAVGQEEISQIPIVEVNLPKSVIVASGLFRKTIFISSRVKQLLSLRELRAVLRHEASHCRQNHNLAKLISRVTPRLLPCRHMDENLGELIEYAADDEACTVPGDALNLASALVIIARQTSAGSGGVLQTAFSEESDSAKLERRVRRLVRPHQAVKGGMFLAMAAGWIAIIGLATALSSWPGSQHAFREALELLVR